MNDDPGTRLAALVELARLSRSKEDRARMERTIQLVSWALQAVAHARLLNGNAAHRREAAEAVVLCRMTVAEARAVGLRIGDNDNWK